VLDLFPSPILFLPSCLYFASLLTPVGRRWALQGAALAAAVGVALMVANVGVAGALVSVGAALVVGLFLGLTGAGSATTALVLMVSLGTLPVGGWPYPLAGFVLAGAIAALRLRKDKGSGYLSMVTGETIAALGVQGAMPGKPDLSRLQLEDAETKESTERGASPKRRAIRLPAYFLVTTIAGAAASFVIG
jgi:hypothetical protein